MIPFQVDPSWYERHWWREDPPHRSLRSRLSGAAASAGRCLWATLRFFGLVLVLIASGDFGVQPCAGASEPADASGEPGGRRRGKGERRDHGHGIGIAYGAAVADVPEKISDDRFDASTRRTRVAA
jgi:hypothetical protein